MRFILFTDKKVPDCVTAINERLQAPASGSRPGLDGWIEKKGGFALAIDSPVMGRFIRQTRLEAHVEREGNTTIIRGQVPGGASPNQQRMFIAAVIALCAFTVVQGQALMGLLLALMGGVLYVPLRGDYDNSEKLLIEVERTLKASPKVPKGLPSSALNKPLPRPITTRPAGKPAAKQRASAAATRKPAVRSARPAPKPGARTTSKPVGVKAKPPARTSTSTTRPKPTSAGTSGRGTTQKPASSGFARPSSTSRPTR